MVMPREDDNTSEYYELHEDEKYILDKQDIEKDNKNLVGKSSDIRSRVRDSLSGCTPQNGLLTSELSLSLKEVKFGKQEFLASKPVSDIKYHHLSS